MASPNQQDIIGHRQQLHDLDTGQWDMPGLTDNNEPAKKKEEKMADGSCLAHFLVSMLCSHSRAVLCRVSKYFVVNLLGIRVPPIYSCSRQTMQSYAVLYLFPLFLLPPRCNNQGKLMEIFSFRTWTPHHDLPYAPGTLSEMCTIIQNYARLGSQPRLGFVCCL